MLKRVRERRDELVRVHRSAVQKPQLRVLFVTSMWPDEERPHYGIFIKTQAHSLEACGVKVDVIAIRGYASSLAYLLARPTIRRAARGCDLVHVHTGHAATVSLLGMARPSVVSFVGGDVLGNPNERGTPLASRLLARFLRQFARASTASITKSHEMERALPRSVRPRNRVIPNGVDLTGFGRIGREQARRQLGWEPHAPVALFLGDPDDPRKNVALAEAAVERLRATRPDVRLHIGWGSHPSQVPLLMAAADVLVFPSRSEGSPNVIKEAMASQLPIVATPVGDVPERLADVAGCFVVPPDAAAFATMLARAIEFGRSPAAREAVAELSLQAIACRVLELYQEVTSRSLEAPGAATPPSAEGEDLRSKRVLTADRGASHG
jgi:teichuronic acid biosynthesis glycosyltransferase TuaC